MSDRRPDPAGRPPRQFVPDLNPLESRALMSTGFSSHWGEPDKKKQGPPTPPPPPLPLPNPNDFPRTGGIFVQTGSVLGIGVGQPTTNTVQVTDDRAGDVQAQWNGGPVHSFTGVTATVIQGQRARHNQITFNLTSPRTSPVAVAVGSIGPQDAVTASRDGHPLIVRRTSGHAVQSGSVLTVTVNRPTTNVVQITNAGGGNVQVEWNGGRVHSFPGVATIVVDTENARKDQVTLTDSTS